MSGVHHFVFVSFQQEWTHAVKEDRVLDPVYNEYVLVFAVLHYAPNYIIETHLKYITTQSNIQKNERKPTSFNLSRVDCTEK